MVLRHFNLREQPFGVTPDPSFLFATETHREALSALLYGIESGLGFIALMANPGMGKTTILFESLRRMGESVRTVFLFQTIQNPTELVRALLIDMGEKNPQGTLVDLEALLNEIVVRHSKTGKRLVVVLDEAQNLDPAVLEAVRMLSNFETANRKLMQIVLCGQMQLAERLADPGLLQLRQRISIFSYLKPLSLDETTGYIEHRLRVAGYIGSKPLFTSEALTLIARHSGGIPRNINNLCFNALSLGCALRKSVVNGDVIREVIGDLEVHRATNEQITITEVEPILRSSAVAAGQRKAWTGLRVVAIAAAIFFAIALAAGTVFLINPAALGVGSKFLPGRSASQPPELRKEQASAVPEMPPVPAPVLSADPVLEAAPQASVPDGSAPPSPAHAPAHHHKRTIAARNRRVPAAGNQVRLVEAGQGQSLQSICSQQFGNCRPALLNRIVELNPHIADPNRVRQGQRVVLPVATAGQAVNNPESAGS